MKPKQKLFEEIKKLLKKNVTGEEKIDLKKLEIWDSLIYLELVSTIEQYTKKSLLLYKFTK